MEIQFFHLSPDFVEAIRIFSRAGSHISNFPLIGNAFAILLIVQAMPTNVQSGVESYVGCCLDAKRQWLALKVPVPLHKQILDEWQVYVSFALLLRN